MTTHPLLPAETDLTALRLELRRTAADLRRVARSLCAAPVVAPPRTPQPPVLRFLPGGRWSGLRAPPQRLS